MWLQVRVRCVGAAGTGHGAWSHSASFETPGTRELASLPSDGIEALSGPGMPRNRRSGRDLHQLEGDDAPPGPKALRVKRADSRSLSECRACASGLTPILCLVQVFSRFQVLDLTLVFSASKTITSVPGIEDVKA